MTDQQQRCVMPRKSRFALNFNKNELPYILDNLGMRHKRTNVFLVNPPRRHFMFASIKEDLKVPQSIPMRVNWFDTGSVFSQARDQAGNMVFNIELGRQRIPMNVAFDQRKLRFDGLYLEGVEIKFSQIKHLL